MAASDPSRRTGEQPQRPAVPQGQEPVVNPPLPQIHSAPQSPLMPQSRSLLPRVQPGPRTIEENAAPTTWLS